ncbi:MAG: ATPase [Acidobacteria bacterium]|nr:MAG: ATPase [Acidobacteriota bacterium]
MLTRLQVQGFKNLHDVDVRFGPFTCIAGANGVGKSNLFDAILFLSKLADKPFVEAVRAIRGGEESPRGLFAAHGENEMSLVAEMLIPAIGEDDFGQRAEASATFVRYELRLRLMQDSDHRLRERIQLDREDLSYIKKGEAKERLAFPCGKEWMSSVILKSPRTRPFISTDAGIVHLHADRMQRSGKAKRGGGKPYGFKASTLPRTVLSSANNAEETRTAVLARNEMRTWRLLQLEPSAMRQPDDFQSSDTLTSTGGHIPATLFRIATLNGDPAREGRVYAGVANRLAELVEGVRGVRVVRDETRKALILMMKDRSGLELPASSLSDGTLRFLALAVLQQDPRETGLICMEEPENGIHPQRIDAILQLLEDIAVDTEGDSDEENPLRQVILNTHSPLVAGRVAEGDLLIAKTRSKRIGNAPVPELALYAIGGTWRAESGAPRITKGEIVSYLQGVPSRGGRRSGCVADRFQLSLQFG